MNEGADTAEAPARSTASYVLAIIAVIIAISATMLALLARSQGEMMRSDQTAADYHLESTVRAGAIARHLWDAHNRLPEHSAHVVTHTPERTDAAALDRIVSLIEREIRAIGTSQQVYAERTFDAPLSRMIEQYDRLALEISAYTGEGTISPDVIHDRLDRFQLRIEQFSVLHWNAYLARDTLAARAEGWRRFILFAIVITAAGLMPIGIAVRQIIGAVRERRANDERHQLLRSELDHRVKNNLASVLSLANQTIRSSTDLEEFRAAFTGRILAMARTHEALAGAKWHGIELGRAASMTLAPHLDTTSSRITIEGNTIQLPAKAAMPVCLILHELCTNAAKHGALSHPDGRVSLSWASDDRAIDLSWLERGGPVVIEPKLGGLGTRLIEGFTRHELGGEVDLDFRPEGLACRITVPIQEGTATT